MNEIKEKSVEVSRTDVKMRLSRPAGRDKRQYKNNISFKYAQSEAEGILNGQITWNKKNFR